MNIDYYFRIGNFNYLYKKNPKRNRAFTFFQDLIFLFLKSKLFFKLDNYSLHFCGFRTF